MLYPVKPTLIDPIYTEYLIISFLLALIFQETMSAENLTIDNTETLDMDMTGEFSIGEAANMLV